MTVVNLQGFCGLGYRLHLTLRILKCCATFKGISKDFRKPEKYNRRNLISTFSWASLYGELDFSRCPYATAFSALESNPIFLLMLSLAIAPSHPSPVAAQQPEPPTPPQPLAGAES